MRPGRRSARRSRRPPEASACSSTSRSTTPVGPRSSTRFRRLVASGIAGCRDRRSRDQRRALHGRAARSRPRHPDRRRAAPLELPDLAVRLRRVLLLRGALARLRSGRLRRRAARVRQAIAASVAGRGDRRQRLRTIAQRAISAAILVPVAADRRARRTGPGPGRVAGLVRPSIGRDRGLPARSTGAGTALTGAGTRIPRRGRSRSYRRALVIAGSGDNRPFSRAHRDRDRAIGDRRWRSILVKQDLTGSLTDWVFSLSGVMYVGLTMAHFVLIRRIDSAPVEMDWVRSADNIIGDGDAALGLAWLLVAILTTWMTRLRIPSAANLGGSNSSRRSVPARRERGH